MMILCRAMANDDSLPELTKILDDNFAEMKIGEDKFHNLYQVTEEIITEHKKIIYQERYTSENQTGKIHVEPIRTKKTPSEASIGQSGKGAEKVIRRPEQVKKQQILDSPTSSIGDDFAVNW